MNYLNKKNILYIFIGLAIGMFIFFYVFGGFADAFTEVIDDDFESYTLDTSPYGINGWEFVAGGSCLVKNTEVFEGEKALYCSNCEIANIFIGGETKTGNISFAIYIPDGEGLTIGLYNVLSQKFYFFLENKGNYIDVQWWEVGVGWEHMYNINESVWYEAQLIFDNQVGNKALLKIGSQSDMADTFSGQEDTEIDRFRIGGTGYYLDGFGVAPIEGSAIWGVSPISGSVITSGGGSFIFNWSNIGSYDQMSVGFNNRLTGISSDYLSFEIDDMIGNSTLVSLDAFNIDRNGDWHFQGFLTNLTPEVYDDVFFSGRYASYTTEDLAYDYNYYLDFNILGYESIFTMETFEDWYSINSTRYDSPTDMFIGITGFFSPIFNKIGEFGQRINDYFNLDEAYSSGYDFGKSIPIFGYYLAQISYFIGNFPFIKWVFIVLLFLIGIFLFRLVLKFIPFLGGS